MSLPPRNPKKKSVRQLTLLALQSVPYYREVTTGEEKLIEYVKNWQKELGQTESKSSTISRNARLIRLQHSELRGKDWDSNQKHARPSVTNQIKNDTFGRTNPDQNLSDFVI